MTSEKFRDVTPENQPLLERALRQLAVDLDDPYKIDSEALHCALFGAHPTCHAALVLGQDETLHGAALYSPVVSTTAGGAGAYISDLWVNKDARGRKLGRKLIAHVALRAKSLWQARFIRLVSYNSNTRAKDFYTSLGFSARPKELVLQLPIDGIETLDG